MKLNKWLIGSGIILALIIGLFVYIFTASPLATENSEELNNEYKGAPIVPEIRTNQIPPLSNPDYLTLTDDLRWISDQDKVIGIVINGQAYAYPIKILNWHEIVNETIDGVNFVVTYNPLTAASAVYSRDSNNQVFSFGNTGALYESSMVMYDVISNTYWNHVTGEGIRGLYQGQFLNPLNSTVTSWGNWKADNFDSKILSLDTGYERNYFGDPYEFYRKLDSEPAYPVSNESDLLPPKQMVTGVTINDVSKAYSHADLKGKTITDKIGGVEVEVRGYDDGSGVQIYLLSAQNKTLLPSLTAYWFSWYTNHPNSLLYGVE